MAVISGGKLPKGFEIIAVNDNQRLMSQKDSGKFIVSFLNKSVVDFYYFAVF